MVMDDTNNKLGHNPTHIWNVSLKNSKFQRKDHILEEILQICE